MLKENYFSRLILHESSTAIEIEYAYKNEKNKYSEKNFPSDEQIKELLQKINSMIDEAYDTLKDKSKRDHYRRSIFSETKLAFEAGLQFDKGDLELLRENYKDAFYLFDSASELVPGDPVYHAAKSLTQYIWFHDKDPEMSKTGLREFNNILKHYSFNEKILYYGYILEKFNNNIRNAANLLKRILEINPENKEANRALKKLQSN